MMQISLFPLGGYDFSVFFTATLKAVVKAVKAIKAGAKRLPVADEEAHSKERKVLGWKLLSVLYSDD